MIVSRGKLVGMTKGSDMSSDFLSFPYISLASRKRGRLTKVAEECHLESRHRPDLPSIWGHRGASVLLHQRLPQSTWGMLLSPPRAFQEGLLDGIAE